MNNNKILAGVQSSKDFVPRRIICLPIDKTAETKHIIEYTITNIATPNDHVILIHGRDTTDDYPTKAPFLRYGISTITMMRIEKFFNEDSERLLSSSIEKFVTMNIVVRGISVKRNRIASTINELDPNLVVIGRREQTPDVYCNNSLGLNLENQFDINFDRMNVFYVSLWNL